MECEVRYVLEIKSFEVNMEKYELNYWLDMLSKYAGVLAAILLMILSLLVVYDAGMRYLFSAGSIALQEIEWHLFDMVFLLGLTYALKHDKHVRVDIFFERYSVQKKAIVQILSMLLLVIPFSLIFLLDAFDMTMQSYLQHEVSADPGGLTHRWIIKAVLVLAFLLLIVQAMSEVLKAYHRIENKRVLWRTLRIVLLIGTLIYVGWYNRVEFWFDPVYLMFALSLVLLMAGFQVAFVFAGVAVLFAAISDEVGLHALEMLPYRTYGIMGNVTLMAVPLFIFMGLILAGLITSLITYKGTNGMPIREVTLVRVKDGERELVGHAGLHRHGGLQSVSILDEIQHRLGSWFLVYGPEPPRTRQGPPVYVGVAIRGRTRFRRIL